MGMQIAGQNRAFVVHHRRQLRRLGARRAAGVKNRVVRFGIEHQRDLLAGTILNDDFPFLQPGIADRIARGADRPAVGLQRPVRPLRQRFPA